mgnify:CR=1 FL=1
MDAETIQVVFETEDGEKMSFATDLVPAREYERVQAENAELRKELAVTNPLFETLNAANDRLIYENMKLRELVRTLYMCSHVRCDQCEYEHENTCDFDTEEELRELGVEVWA